MEIFVLFRVYQCCRIKLKMMERSGIFVENEFMENNVQVKLK